LVVRGIWNPGKKGGKTDELIFQTTYANKKGRKGTPVRHHEVWTEGKKGKKQKKRGQRLVLRVGYFRVVEREKTQERKKKRTKTVAAGGAVEVGGGNQENTIFRGL